MSYSHDPRVDRPSDAPLTVETTGSTSLPSSIFASFASMRDGFAGQLYAQVHGAIAARVPPQYLGLAGYLAAGIALGLMLILVMSLGRTSPSDAPSVSATSATTTTTAAAAPTLTDNVTRLHAREIGSTCWQGIDKDGPARLTVSLEIGTDGRVRYAAAAGESAAMRSCVEAHVRSWEFLPQARPTAMALPFEVDRR